MNQLKSYLTELEEDTFSVLPRLSTSAYSTLVGKLFELMKVESANKFSGWARISSQMIIDWLNEFKDDSTGGGYNLYNDSFGSHRFSQDGLRRAKFRSSGHTDSQRDLAILDSISNVWIEYNRQFRLVKGDNWKMFVSHPGTNGLTSPVNDDEFILHVNLILDKVIPSDTPVLAIGPKGQLLVLHTSVGKYVSVPFEEFARNDYGVSSLVDRILKQCEHIHTVE